MEASETAQRFAHEQWPYEPKFKRVNGWPMAFGDEGVGDPVVLLHGNPAWGFLYRKFIKPLTAAGRRVIIPDLIGFGLAENPVRVCALVIMSTWAWPLPPAEFHKRIFPWRMMHAPLIGPYLLGRHNALAGRGMYLSVVDRKRFRDEAQSAYEGILPDPAARLLTWTWPSWIPLDDTARGLEP